MDLFTLKNIQRFVEQRINLNADCSQPEPDFDNQTCEELWIVRAFIAEQIRKEEEELDQQMGAAA